MEANYLLLEKMQIPKYRLICNDKVHDILRKMELYKYP